MKKLLLLASATVALGAFAAPASAADVTGTVSITGLVAAKCTVITGGSGSTFSSTIPLGELSNPDGTLSTAYKTSTFVAPASAVQNFRVTCTGANNAISVTANPIVSAVNAPTGFTNKVDYTGAVEFAVVGGAAVTPENYTADTTVSGGVVTGVLGANVRLANTANNIQVRIYGLKTANATDVLVAGNDYLGSVVITVGPGA
jgi:hypothetical protein